MFRQRALIVCVIAAVASCKQEEKAAPAAPVAPHALVVKSKDFAFMAPDTVPAGVTTITLGNDGPGIHHLQLVKLDSGKTVADLMGAMKNPGPFPRWAQFASGPNAAMPGAATSATVDLTPGNYVMICLVDVPDRIPHFAKGMVRPLTVVASSGAAAAWPQSEFTITTTEYTFAIPDTIKAGMHDFTVKLAGAQPHEVVVFKFLPGKTMKDLQKWAADYKGPPPVTALGGVTTAMPGMQAQFVANLQPGNYVLVCFVPDIKDGKPHMEHGMVKGFVVL